MVEGDLDLVVVKNVLIVKKCGLIRASTVFGLSVWMLALTMN